MRKILKRIVTVYGDKILLDDARIRGLLKDYRIEERRVIQLNTLMQISLFKDIIRNNYNNSHIYRIIKQCQAKTAFPAEDIEYAVNAILYALGREELYPPPPKDNTQIYRLIVIFSFGIAGIIAVNMAAVILNIYRNIYSAVFCIIISLFFIANDIYFYHKKSKNNKSLKEIINSRVNFQIGCILAVFMIFAYIRG